MKSTIIVVTITLFTLKSKAQDFIIGLSGGSNISTFRYSNKGKWNENVKFSPILTYNINGLIRLSYDKCGISLNPGITQKGAKYSTNALQKATYIQFLTLFYVNINPKLSILTGAETNYLVDDKLIVEDSKIDLIGLNKKFEIAPVIGAQYSLTKKVEFGLKYSTGVTKFFTINLTNDIGENIGQSNFYNQMLQLFINYKIKNNVKKS